MTKLFHFRREKERSGYLYPHVSVLFDIHTMVCVKAHLCNAVYFLNVPFVSRQAVYGVGGTCTDHNGVFGVGVQWCYS